MRLLGVVVLCLLLACGCARKKSTPSGNTPGVSKSFPVSTGTNATLLVTPGKQLSGRVSSVNPTSRFIIATFPIGSMPFPNQRMNVFREGLKVGVIKITGPQRDVLIAADIVEGECRIGDEIKAEQ